VQSGTDNLLSAHPKASRRPNAAMSVHAGTNRWQHAPLPFAVPRCPPKITAPGRKHSYPLSAAA